MDLQLSNNNYRVVSLSKLYLTVSEIIIRHEFDNDMPKLTRRAIRKTDGATEKGIKKIIFLN